MIVKPAKEPSPRPEPKPYLWEKFFGPSRYRQEMDRLKEENQQLREDINLSALRTASEDHIRLEDIGRITSASITHNMATYQRDEIEALVTFDDYFSQEVLELAHSREVVSYRGQCWVIDGCEQASVFSSSPNTYPVCLQLVGIVNPERTGDAA